MNVGNIIAKTVQGLGFEKSAQPSDNQPELDDSPLCDELHHRKYQQMIGIGIWLNHIGRIDITHAVASLSRFSAAPRVGHLKRIERVYRYLHNWDKAQIRIDARPHEKLGEVQFKDADWSQSYNDAFEELDDRFPIPKIPPLDSHIY